MNEQGGSSHDPPRPAVAVAAMAVHRPGRRVRADALLGGGREVIIEHGADEYRLRITSKGKLILTK